MQKIFFLFIFWACLPCVNAQTLQTLFVSLPDSCFEPAHESWYKPLDAAGRAALLKNKQYDTYKLSFADPKNGYLLFMTTSDGPGYELKMTYWKCADGSRLVALNIMASGMSFAYTKRLWFLHYLQGQWTDVSSRHLPELSLSDFYVPEQAPEKVETKAMRWLFSLPQAGVNIAVHPPEADDESTGSGPAWYYEMQWKSERFELVRKAYQR